MDFINGGELYTHINGEGRLGEDRARFYAGEVLLALEYLHELGICYRDLKPENILLDSEGHVKLADFGQSTDQRSKGGRTRLYSLVGSPYYMAPEIFLKTGHGKEVDFWSFGVLIYEMLVGLPPFYSENTNEAYQRLLAEPIPYPSILSISAIELLKALLVVDPAHRFGADAAALSRRDSEAQKIRAKWGHFAWFATVPWERILAREVAAPFLPKVAGPTDVSNFSEQFTSEVVEDLSQKAVGQAMAMACLSSSNMYPVGSMFSHGDISMFDGFDYFRSPEERWSSAESEKPRGEVNSGRDMTSIPECRTPESHSRSMDKGRPSGHGGSITPISGSLSHMTREGSGTPSATSTDSSILDRFDSRVARVCEDLHKTTVQVESHDILRRFGKKIEARSAAPPSTLSKVHAALDKFVQSPKEQLQSWFSKGLQADIARSPRRSRKGQEWAQREACEGLKADPDPAAARMQPDVRNSGVGPTTATTSHVQYSVQSHLDLADEG